MKMVNIFEAKTRLSELIKMVTEGDHVIIGKNGTPVAMIVPYSVSGKPRLGSLKGKVKVGKDFDAPLPEHIGRHFEGLDE